MKTNILIISLIILFFLASNLVEAKNMTAPAPLYRDPVTDGAADPVLIWNREEKCWWMLYTQRRANLEAAGVAYYCYGTPIGIA